MSANASKPPSGTGTRQNRKKLATRILAGLVAFLMLAGIFVFSIIELLG